MLNIALLDQTLQYIKDHPEEHSQLAYVSLCGSTMCIAGHALLQSGQYKVVSDTEFGMLQFRHLDGSPVEPGRDAARVLGLSEDQRYALFIHAQNMPAVERVVEAIKVGVDGHDLLRVVYLEVED